MADQSRNPAGVAALKNTKLQGYLRGLLDRNANDTARTKTLKRAFEEVTKEDIDAFGAVLYGNPLFKHLNLDEAASNLGPFYAERNTIAPLRDEVLLSHLSNRVAINQASIIDQLEAVALINQLLLKGEHFDAVVKMGELIDRHGCTIQLYKKISAGYAIYSAKSEQTNPYLPLLKRLGYRSGIHSANVTTDAISWQYDFIRLRRAVETSSRNRKSTTFSNNDALAVQIFNPIPLTNEAFFQILKQCWTVSLYDAFVFLMMVKSTAPLQIHCADEFLVSEQLNHHWGLLQASASEAPSLLSPMNEHEDYFVFRVSRAFLENKGCLELCLLGQVYYTDSGSRGYLDTSTQPLLNQSLERFQDFPTLIQTIKAGDNSSGKDHTQHVFRNTVSTLHLFKMGASLDGVSATDFALLMGATRDLDRLSKADELQKQHSSTKDEFTKLILSTLLRAKSDSDWDNFRFKKSLQDYVIGNHSGNLVSFMSEIQRRSTAIVPYYISLLDETMISQLHRIIPSSRLVYETRANILDWFSEAFGDELSHQRAVQLRVDRKIDDLRGAINEARLNIDSARFHDWVADNHLPDIVAWLKEYGGKLPDFASVSKAEKSLIDSFTNKQDVFSLGVFAILSCYREFCVNAHFGITSYLGRRIRHGTLKGTLLNGLSSVLADPEFEPLLGTEVETEYREWLKKYEENVNSVVTSIHFDDKRDNVGGWISSSPRNAHQWNTLRGAVANMAINFSREGQLSVLPQYVEHVSWLTFEGELEHLQRVLRSLRPKWGTFSTEAATWSSLTVQTNRFMSRVNSTTDANFKTCIGWFKKPNNISPSALFSDILRLVLAEAKDAFPDFQPALKETGLSDLTLGGAMYYRVYDALYILISNAAEHGKRNGTLTVDLRVRSYRSGRSASVRIISELRASDSVARVQDRVKATLSQSAERADLLSKRSGLLKMELMQRRGEVSTFRIACGPLLPEFSAEIEFQVEGLYEDSGG